jgi:hypothetical protein
MILYNNLAHNQVLREMTNLGLLKRLKSLSLLKSFHTIFSSIKHRNRWICANNMDLFVVPVC